MKNILKDNNMSKSKQKTPSVETKAVSWDGKGNVLKYQSTGSMEIDGHVYSVSGFPGQTTEKALRSLMAQCGVFKQFVSILHGQVAIELGKDA